MQGALEWLGILYTGSGVLASPHHDKLKTKPCGRRRSHGPAVAVLTGAKTSATMEEVGLPERSARLAGLERGSRK